MGFVEGRDFLIRYEDRNRFLPRQAVRKVRIIFGKYLELRKNKYERLRISKNTPLDKLTSCNTAIQVLISSLGFVSL